LERKNKTINKSVQIQKLSQQSDSSLSYFTVFELLNPIIVINQSFRQKLTTISPCPLLPPFCIVPFPKNTLACRRDKVSPAVQSVSLKQSSGADTGTNSLFVDKLQCSDSLQHICTHLCVKVSSKQIIHSL